MPGQLDGLKNRKRKNTSAAKSPEKGSTARRKCVKSPKTHMAAESSSTGGADGEAATNSERLSRISCECLRSAGRRRCSASPLLDGKEGKENLRETPYDVEDGPEEMDCAEGDKNVFPDDDSNQILPVEQFFGNLDAVQDFPARTSATSSRRQKEHRRRHYFAREDSDEEEERAEGDGTL
ncbi:UPF0688 protein C1orf174 homolog [Corythoichthys intestinalis]|uniref:UPF0688 protein C1orf174 homolog n=1 Tax=Corythoichthys intestinalis TaxID=161448 RepID=UPI0025A6329E|nr:UPF0688 protein C1orf174 homolog [Corythoichthys intestinalis]